MTTNYPAQDSTPAPMTRRQKRRTIAGIIAISATVAGLSAACGPDDNSTEGAAAVGYSAPVSSSSYSGSCLVRRPFSSTRSS